MSDAKKPWEEVWVAREASVMTNDTFEEWRANTAIASRALRPDSWPEYDRLAQFISAAPDLYLMLKKHEFCGTAVYFGDVGNGICPECAGSGDWDHPMPMVHTNACAWDAALKKARGEP